MTSAALAGPLDNTAFVSMYGGWAIQESDPVLDGFIGTDQELSPGDNGAVFGFEAGRPLNEAWDVRASLNATILRDDEVVDSFTNPFNVLDVINTTSTSEFSFQTLDLEFGYRPGVVGNHIRLFAGPRGLHASSEVAKVGTFDNDVELWGGGLRAGAQADIPLSDRLSISLLGAGSAVAAHTESENDPGIVQGRDEEWRGVYGVEGLAAIDVAVTDRMALQLGYRAEQNWNLTSVVDVIGSADVDEGDLLTHGPVARVTIKLP